jgi:predicted HD superfamily hydrolase involved in NAD metabolism
LTNKKTTQKGELKQVHLTLEQAAAWVKPRVSARRFQHIEGVVATASQLAKRFDCDPYLAQLAAWLHDACKEKKDSELIEQAKGYGLVLSEADEKNGHLLHGPVAAKLVEKELQIENDDVLRAMAEHTLGAKAMSRLSKIVFLADALEPGRPADYTAPIWHVLSIGDNSESTLNTAVLATLDANLADLIACQRAIHPKTVDVRNYYLELVKD